MSKVTVFLNKEYGLFLESKDIAIDLFNKIPQNTEEVIFNFSLVNNMGCFFAREYLKLKKISSCNIIELYMSDSIKEVFSLVSSFDDDLTDEEFIHKLIENTCNQKINSDELY